MIVEQILVTQMAVFCYLIVDEVSHEGILVDPAGDFDRIFDKVEKYSVDVKWIVNTHGHPDHTSGNKEVMDKTGARLLIHKEDIKLLGRIPDDMCDRYNSENPPDKPILYLLDNDSITIGEKKLWVIHTPGHSEGGICLYLDGNVFTGDTLFTEGMGRTDFPGCSYEKIMDSIKNRILSLPDDTVIWPGHHYGRDVKSTVSEQKKIYMS